MQYEDKELVCVDPEHEGDPKFIWSDSEQKYFADQKFEGGGHPPKRCYPCRKRRREKTKVDEGASHH